MVDKATVKRHPRREGMPSHENMVFSCFGGLSNTGITSALACMEVVKEIGLRKVAIGCLPSVPPKVGPVLGKTRAAKNIITITGIMNHICAIGCP